jgi:hypothetical protein
MAVRSFDLPTVVWSIETVLPDFAFDVASLAVTDQRATVEWVLRGTNSKPLKAGIDPTGKVTTLHGVEVFEGASGFTRVQRYFYQKTLYETNKSACRSSSSRSRKVRRFTGIRSGLRRVIRLRPQFSE